MGIEVRKAREPREPRETRRETKSRPARSTVPASSGRSARGGLMADRWSPGAVSRVAFVYEVDDCPVLARIEAALAGLRAARAAETN